jgi:hypothetical protein
MKTDDYILIEALNILSKDIQSQDGVANACISEAANRMKELLNEITILKCQLREKEMLLDDWRACAAVNKNS